MKYLPAIVSACVALVVAAVMVRELVPQWDFSFRTPVAADTAANGVVGTRESLSSLIPERMYLEQTEATAPAGPGQTAYLTVNPSLQKQALAALRARSVNAGLVLLLDLQSGGLLVYASKTGDGGQDPITGAAFGATDLMKVVTVSVLAQAAGVTASTRECFRDPGKTLELDDLVPESARDKWCPSFAESLGRNLDAPLARAVQRHLTPQGWEQAAEAFGFAQPLPFDLPVSTSKLVVPSGTGDASSGLGWLAAPLGNETGQPATGTRISGLHALMIASAVATKGLMLEPRLVNRLRGPDGKVLYQAVTRPKPYRRLMTPEAAEQVANMMFDTVAIGDGFRAFHDEQGQPLLGALEIAAKTGADRATHAALQTTWFIGFAPASDPKVAFATMALNRRGASGNAQALALDLLRAHFEVRGETASSS